MNHAIIQKKNIAILFPIGIILKGLKYRFLITASNYFLFVRKSTFYSVDWYVYLKHHTMDYFYKFATDFYVVGLE